MVPAAADHHFTMRATRLVDVSPMHWEALKYAGAPPPFHFQPMVTLSTLFHGHSRVLPSCAGRDIVTKTTALDEFCLQNRRLTALEMPQSLPASGRFPPAQKVGYSQFSEILVFSCFLRLLHSKITFRSQIGIVASESLSSVLLVHTLHSGLY